jgi:hypothetical protein
MSAVFTSHNTPHESHSGERRLRKLTLCAGIFFAVIANAALTSRATLVGQHVHVSPGGSSALICEYSGIHAKFEIVSQHGTCAPYIDVQ